MNTRISEAGLVYEFPESEQNVYDEIMGDQIYSVHSEILRQSNKHFRVIDIGAHVGMATLYYWLTWQDSGLPGNFRADCYEPHPELFSLCRKNCAIATNGVSAINAGVVQGEDDKAIGFGLQDNSGWLCCTRLAPNSSNPVRTVAAAETLQYAPAGDIDILKIDTEGMEVGILTGYAEARAIDRFRCIMIEYHSESDRRLIDSLLTNHTLYDARVICQRRCCVGVVKYIRNDFIGA